MNVSPAQRFWPKVAQTGNACECWIWMSTIATNGYGRFKLNPKKSVPAHRFAYEQTIGMIPDGLEIDHLCRERACVNPAHMEPVTHKVNTLRSLNFTAVHAAKTHCPKGHPYDMTDGRGSRMCRACNRVKQLAWYHANKGSVRAYRRKVDLTPQQ